MPDRSFFTAAWFGPLAIAFVAWCALLARLDPAGSYPQQIAGPGLTVDEMFNVEQGVYLVEAVRQYGLALFDWRSITEIFGADSPYLPDHPPLGRLWLGAHHHLARGLFPPVAAFDSRLPVTACARTGSATAFALTILLAGWYSSVNFGVRAGWLSSLLLTFLPRLWGHAHLASLETITNLMCTAAVLAVAHGWNKASPPTVRASLIAGVCLGLAFLTKIQAILLPAPLIMWALWRWRWLAVKPLLIGGVATAVVFFVGWPWLWLNPVEHAREYFARTTARATLSVWYFGEHYTDKQVPWHYPWVIFFSTIPSATVFVGCRAGWPHSLVSSVTNTAPSTHPLNSDWSINWLLMGCIFWPLVVFSLPGIAVYDCERLFLTAFPLWAILTGRTADLLLNKTGPSFWPWWRFLFAAIVLVIQFVNIVRFAPCHLSFYNQLIGGTAGAERLGLETTYWGDSLTRRLLEDVVQQVPRGETVLVAPVLHQFQLDDLLRQSPILQRHRVILQPYDGQQVAGQYLLLFRRRADLPDELRTGPVSAELLAETRHGTTQLAALYRFTPKVVP